MQVFLKRIVGKNSQLVRYLVIGCSGAFIDFTIFYLFVRFTDINYQVVNLFSVSCGIINNYVLNARFNFAVKDNYLFRFSKFYLVGLFGWVLTAVLLFVFVEMWSAPKLAAKVVTIFVVAITQFCLNKRYTFNEAIKR